MPEETTEPDLERLQRRFEELQLETARLQSQIEQAQTAEEKLAGDLAKPSGKRMWKDFEEEPTAPIPRES